MLIEYNWPMITTPTSIHPIPSTTRCAPSPRKAQNDSRRRWNLNVKVLSIFMFESLPQYTLTVQWVYKIQQICGAMNKASQDPGLKWIVPDVHFLSSRHQIRPIMKVVSVQSHFLSFSFPCFWVTTTWGWIISIQIHFSQKDLSARSTCWSFHFQLLP